MNGEAAGATVDLHPPGAPGPARTGGPGPFAPGRVLRDRYVIVERLGAGGRGSVFKARDRYRASLPAAEQHVALKIVHACGDSPDQVMRDLARELHCCLGLSHRNIVRVYELDRHEEVVFFTMELLDGELLWDLMERLKPNPLPPSQAWSIIRQLADGLQYAHERGIVHGDLKPRNLFLTRSGDLRILDFGAAQSTAQMPVAPEKSKSSVTYGTPAYASCEQLEGRVAEPSDDLYALAVICYQLLAGAHPFAGRPATHARNYAVRANRPAGLTADQWRVLQTGLAWHRSLRSMPVHTWVSRLTRGVRTDGSSTPVNEWLGAGAKRTRAKSLRVAACAAVLSVTAMGMGGLWHRSVQKHSDGLATAVAMARIAQSPGEKPVAARGADDGSGTASAHAAAPGAAPAAAAGPVQNKPPATPARSRIVVDGYQVGVGHRFVEVRVHRNQLAKDSSFFWWTEPATARQNVDYIHQAKAIQTFPAGRRSTRVYVKLLPEADRTQRDYFFLAIAQPGPNGRDVKVTRAQIWLPTPRAGLQASR